MRVRKGGRAEEKHGEWWGRASPCFWVGQSVGIEGQELLSCRV
jgi:hypothetical protein